MSRDPAPRTRTRTRALNPLRSLVSAVRSPFSPKSTIRPRTLSTDHVVVDRRRISSPHPDEDTQAIGNRIGVDLNTAQRSLKTCSTPSLLNTLPKIPSSPMSITTFTTTSGSGSSTPFDAGSLSSSSVSLYSQSSSATRPQPRVDYRTVAPSNTPVTKTQSRTNTPTRPRPLRAPVPVPPVLRQQQAQLRNHPYSISIPSYSRPTPAAYPDLAASRTRHLSLPSLDRSTSTALPKPPPLPDTPLPPLPTTAPPPRPQRNAARPSTAGNDRRLLLRATVSTDGDVFMLRQNPTAASPTARPRRPRQHASSSTLYF